MVNAWIGHSNTKTNKKASHEHCILAIILYLVMSCAVWAYVHVNMLRSVYELGYTTACHICTYNVIHMAFEKWKYNNYETEYGLNLTCH